MIKYDNYMDLWIIPKDAFSKKHKMKLKDETLLLVDEYGIKRVMAMRKHLKTRKLGEIENALDEWKEKSYRKINDSPFINNEDCLAISQGYIANSVALKILFGELGDYFDKKYKTHKR